VSISVAWGAVLVGRTMTTVAANSVPAQATSTEVRSEQQKSFKGSVSVPESARAPILHRFALGGYQIVTGRESSTMVKQLAVG
jgi:hypothetical protein